MAATQADNAAVEPTDSRHLCRDDLVTVLLGCSLTFDAALLRAGLPYRQQEEGGADRREGLVDRRDP